VGDMAVLQPPKTNYDRAMESVSPKIYYSDKYISIFSIYKVIS